MPEVWRIRSRIMIGRLGGTSSLSLPSPVTTPTFMSFKAGRNWPMGELSRSLPSSTNIIAASAITGLVIEDRQEDGIAWHHGASLAIAKSIGLMEGNPAVPADHHDRAGNFCLVYSGTERGAEALKPC